MTFLSVKDVRDGQIFFNNCKYISQAQHDQLCDRCFPEPGDIVVTKSGTIGRLAVVRTNRPLSLFVSVALMKPVSAEFNREWFAMMFEAWINTLNISADVKGTAIKNLHLDQIRPLRFPFPPVEEQNVAVERIRRADELARSVRSRVTNAEAELASLDQSILAKAFRGELVP